MAQRHRAIAQTGRWRMTNTLLVLSIKLLWCQEALSKVRILDDLFGPPDKPLQGKVAVVTGGSSGIGLGIAKCLVEAGASVALAARREDKLEEARQKMADIGGKVIAVKTDVCIRQEVQALQ